MSITLSASTQKLLEDRIKSGEFGSADDVVSAALNALDTLSAPALDQRTLDAIDRAEDQIERGQVHDWNAVRERVRARFLGK